MTSLKALAICLFCLQVLQLVFPLSASAYIDLGSGSYVIQIILASLLGVFFMTRTYWKRLKIYFQKLTAKGHRDEKSTRP
jgi:hypothetical protein